MLEGRRVRTADLEAASALVARLFATAEDVGPFLRAVRRFPRLAALARRCRGLRPVLIGEPFEALIWAVIGQQVNIAFAARLKQALLHRFGGSLVEGGRPYPLFPAPERLARLRRADLSRLQFSRQKADYILGLSRAVTRGALDFGVLTGLPTAEAVARLTAFKGVGRWTAEYVLLRGLGDRDALPAADGGLRRVVGEEAGLGRLATEEEVRAIAAPLAGWRGYLAFYWWFVLQEGKGRAGARARGRGPGRGARA
jgi:DNA-3-methyladenine glycosylase II